MADEERAVVVANVAADILKALLTAGVSPVLDAVSIYPVPARLMLNPLNVAIPAAAFTVAVPDKAAPLVPVPEVMERVTAAVDVVIVLPLASWTATTG